MWPKLAILWSDLVVWATLALLLGYGWRASRSAALRATWLKVLRDRAAVCSAVVLVLFFAVAVVDSLHFRRALGGAPGQAQAYATRTESLLDVLLARQLDGREASYSAPLAMRVTCAAAIAAPRLASAPAPALARILSSALSTSPSSMAAIMPCPAVHFPSLRPGLRSPVAMAPMTVRRPGGHSTAP